MDVICCTRRVDDSALLQVPHLANSFIKTLLPHKESLARIFASDDRSNSDDDDQAAAYRVRFQQYDSMVHHRLVVTLRAAGAACAAGDLRLGSNCRGKLHPMHAVLADDRPMELRR